MTKFHVYRCKSCSLVFAVSQDLEDQSAVRCPDGHCGEAENLEDAGELWSW